MSHQVMFQWPDCYQAEAPAQHPAYDNADTAVLTLHWPGSRWVMTQEPDTGAEVLGGHILGGQLSFNFESER